MTTNHKTLLGHRASVPEWLAQHLMNQKVLGLNPSNCFFRIQNACTSLQEKSRGKLVFIFPLGFSVVFIYHLKTARSSSMLINANNVFVLLLFFFFFRTCFLYILFRSRTYYCPTNVSDLIDDAYIVEPYLFMVRFFNRFLKDIRKSQNEMFLGTVYFSLVGNLTN